MKKDEKDAGSRFWYARISLASFELGCVALNLRSRDCSWRVEGEQLEECAGPRISLGEELRQAEELPDRGRDARVLIL